MPERPARADGLRVAVLTRAVTPLHGVGGLERSTFDLVQHLLARGARVDALHPRLRRRESPGSTSAWRSTSCPTARFPGPAAMARRSSIVRRRTRCSGTGSGAPRPRWRRPGDIDLVYGLGASTLGYAAARRRSPGATVPLVLNPQGLEEFGGADGSYGGRPSKRIGYEPLRRAVRYCAAAADSVIATDRALEPMIARTLRVGPDRMRLVPNAVDLPGCDRLASAADGARLRERAGIGPGEIVLLSVARLERNKGLHVLADALGSLKDLAWRWVVVGDGPFRGELDARVAGHGLRDRMRMTGRLDDAAVHAWYEAASIFVHPTQYQGSSIVTLEAMSHRRPVVATTAGGLPDKVRDGVTDGSCPRATRPRSRAPCEQRLARGRSSLQWASPAARWWSRSSRGTARPIACWRCSVNC